MVCQLKKVFAMCPRRLEEKTVLPNATQGMSPACAGVRAGQGTRVIAAYTHPAGGESRFAGGQTS
ncbi:hypothetical protein SAMN05720382_11349 [Polaromonas sp. JS666]|nr:hypothetical protein SAMN05720382_11349 [Polaromonas sp. JS666]